jgi:hypothetical protein
MTKISDLYSRWSKDTAYKAAYGDLREEFDLARALALRAGDAHASADRLRTTADALIAGAGADA